MEVRIKDNNGYVDADWTIEDGVMVVSPKVEKFEPKDGDVVTVTTETGGNYTCFFKGCVNGDIYSYGGLNNLYNMLFEIGLVCCSKRLKNIHPATEEEKKLLFDKLKEEGYEWDAENKKLIQLKWRPKEGGSFWMPCHYAISVEFKPCNSLFNKGRDEVLLNKGWCFKTYAECQAFCDKLNKTIEGVKS